MPPRSRQSSVSKDVAKTPWGRYLQKHLNLCGWSYGDLARAADMDRSQIGRYVRDGTQPDIKSIRAICEALHRDIREGVVAAGFFTAAELKVADPNTDRPDFTNVSDQELLAEVERRMQRHLAAMGQGYQGRARVVPVDAAQLNGQSFQADAAEMDEQGFVADQGELTAQPTEADSPETSGGGSTQLPPPASAVTDPFRILQS
jgi:transcriptional regulator with XRE-family HTH domain